MVAEQARIAENVRVVRQQIAEAAVRSGRQASDVQLVAVTKYVDPDVIRTLVACGCHVLGESRPQVLWSKADVLSDVEIAWHLIGHLQRNKLRRTLPLCQLVHSGDSRRLLVEMNKEAIRMGCPVDVLLEVNISGDAEKHGFDPQQVAAELPAIAELDHLRILGLMAMATRGSSSEEARRDFAALRDLRDQLEGDCPDNIDLSQLSMGMSNDFQVAIEEGATVVRVGSALFAGLER